MSEIEEIKTLLRLTATIIKPLKAVARDSSSNNLEELITTVVV
jgi:hypothetical protein